MNFYFSLSFLICTTDLGLLYETFFESKRKEWFNSVQELTKNNQEFQIISQLVITEISQVFSSILSQGNSINTNYHQIVQVNHAIRRDLEALHSTSARINHLLKQIRHLVVQTSILAHQAQSSPQGYNKINSEMNKIITEIINCNQQINQLANYFKSNTQKTQDITHHTQEITRSIHDKIKRGEMAIQELEKIANQNEISLLDLIETPAKNIFSNGSESLELKSELMEPTLNSDTLAVESTSQPLIHLIERTLKKQSPSSLV